MSRKDACDILPVEPNPNLARSFLETIASPGASRLWLMARCCAVLGLALRAYHFARNPSVWHDEAALILNVISKPFGELLGPLYFAEAGPPLFLWLERAMRLALGDGVFALRLLPFAASCAALLMVASTARRLLLPAAVPVAVLLFACSSSLLWHASEAKPYAVDVAVAALLPMLTLSPIRGWALEKRLIFFALLAPVIVWLSFPGCFLMGGVVLSLLPEAWRCCRQSSTWLAFLLLVASLGGAFLILLLGPIRAQHCAEMESCWLHAFAPWDRPWRLPLWTVVSAFGLPRYCIDPAGDLLLAPAILGFVSLWRRGYESLVILLTSPIILAFFAACLRAYPFDASRVIAFASPALALGVGEGSIVVGAWLWHSLARTGQPLARWGMLLAAVLLIIVLLLPLGRAMNDVIKPWSRADAASAARFVLQERRQADLVVGNHWEHAYYFRSLRNAFVYWDGRPVPDVPRFWFVVTAGTEAERDLLITAAMAERYHPAAEKRFEQCRAVLMVRNEPLALSSKE